MAKDLHNLRGKLEGADPHDPKAFGPLFTKAMRILELDNGDMATFFGLSLQGVERWKDGRAIPSWRVRAFVYATLIDMSLGTVGIPQTNG